MENKIDTSKFYENKSDWAIVQKIQKKAWTMPFYTKAQFQDILNYIIKESLKKDSQTKIELFKEIEGDSYYKWYFKNKVNTIIHKPLQEVIILPAGMFDMKEEGEDLGIKGVKID